MDYSILKNLAQSGMGKDFIRFMVALENHLFDMRTAPNPTAEALKARKDAAQVMNEHITNKLKALTGELESPDNEEWT